MERASHALGPVTIAIGRLTGGAIVIALVWCLRRHRFRLAELSRQDWARITLVTLIANAWPFVVQPHLLAQGFGHGFFGMMVSLVPLATIAVSIPMLGVWPTTRQLVGVLGGLACIGAILWDGADRGMSGSMLMLAVSVPMVYAWGNTYLKWRLSHVPAVPLSMLMLAIAATSLVPLQSCPPALNALDLAAPPEPKDWKLALAALAWLGTVGTGMTIVLFVHLVLQRGPLFAGMITYVVPVLALMWGRFDHETITARQLAAIAGVLAMVALVQFGPPAQTVAVEAAGEPELIEPVFCPAENLDDESEGL